MPRPKALDVIVLEWGWITPGTNEYLRHEQSDKHLEFLAQPVRPDTRHLLFTHCGWWLDGDAGRSVRDLTGRNPEPHRHLTPADSATLAWLRAYVEQGRLEYYAYPYAACVAEATTGEGLLRSLRLSRDLAVRWLGRRPRVMCVHDCVYGLDWGAAQVPQIARLLGFDLILASREGIVEAPDGTRLRFLGTSRSAGLTLAYGPDPARPHMLGFELHNHLEFMELRRQAEMAADERIGAPLRAIRLNEYLRRVPPGPVRDSRRLGTKGWYGGTIDSLLQEQNAKSLEVRLPAIEALAALASAARLDSVVRRMTDLWKRSFILMDNHTLWQCHNYKAHYLPRSFEALAEARGIEARLLGAKAGGPRRVIFNPTPWTRDLVVADGSRTLVARRTPGWGARVVATNAATPRRGDDDPLSLSNDLAAYRLNAAGEVVEARRDSRRQEFAGLGRLMRIHESPSRETFLLRAGEERAGIEAALMVVAEADLSAAQPYEVSFAMDDFVGAPFMMRVEMLGRNGEAIQTTWEPLQSVHWGGAGMPRREGCVAPRRFRSWGATRARLTVWMLAEGRVRLGRGRLWTSGRVDGVIEIGAWRVRVLYRNAYSAPAETRARVTRSDTAMKTVRFLGRLPDLRYRMDVTLAAGSPALEYALRLTFPQPTVLGLTSPPFTEADGSVLGAECERPYVPGVCVLFPMPGPAAYYSDKPFEIRRAFEPSEQTWHTDRTDWWLGMSAFIGMNLAVAEWRGGQVGLFTRGIKHFFRWRRGEGEALGLSLGASLIHQQTQGHSVPPQSPLYEVAKRTSHNPYFETPFLRAHGDYEFHYALCPAERGVRARWDLWRRSQEFALPPAAVSTDAPAGAWMPGVATAPDCVVLTALEPRDGMLAARLFNASDRAVTGRVTLPFPIRLARRFPDRRLAKTDGCELAVSLAPWAVREAVVVRQSETPDL